METDLKLPSSALILVGLSWVSHHYNRWIDKRHQLGELPDGETEMHVAGGVAYTLAGAGILTGIWAKRLPADWRLGVVATGICLFAFVASGWPMLWGGVNRSASLRKISDAHRTLRS